MQGRLENKKIRNLCALVILARSVYQVAESRIKVNASTLNITYFTQHYLTVIISAAAKEVNERESH